MVSYVILIVIAIGLSTAVYAYLKLFVPKDTPQCPDNVYLGLENYNCAMVSPTSTVLNITLTNRGHFTVDGAYIRFGNATRRVLQQINNDSSFYLAQSSTQVGLLPANSVFRTYEIHAIAQVPGDYLIEVQPAVLDDRGTLVACNDAVILQPITCQ